MALYKNLDPRLLSGSAMPLQGENRFIVGSDLCKKSTPSHSSLFWNAELMNNATSEQIMLAQNLMIKIFTIIINHHHALSNYVQLDVSSTKVLEIYLSLLYRKCMERKTKKFEYRRNSAISVLCGHFASTYKHYFRNKSPEKEVKTHEKVIFSKFYAQRINLGGKTDALSGIAAFTGHHVKGHRTSLKHTYLLSYAFMH